MAFIFSCFLSFFHPFFVSVIDMKHNAKDKNIEVSVKVFTDDLEAVLKKQYHISADLYKQTNDPTINNAITKYLQSKLQMSIDGKPKILNYIGYEIQKESAWIYVEIDDIATIKKMNIQCNLFYDYQEKQMNIFNIKANGSEKNYKLDYPKNNVEFSW
jgi:hypothetical protein